ncbi:sulfate ABC transporter substrate-binding protein [Haemophilus parahaemolyticus]|uniref:sulfate ABC transporter substrate-binding protein n=1 Tax=Haemophilus parahaemolyticus TaxID=735 RepID=UPI002491A318|nr:sulfate ABC transporter substrate-binding protein [Haemophilus parahaemolyticus]
MKKIASILALSLLIGGIFWRESTEQKSVLLNVSYDVIRDFYKEYNPQFRQAFAPDLMISQSHGGASKQVLAVLNGLPADVVTLTQSNDVDALAKKGLVAQNWRKVLPNGAVPFGSVMVLLVKKGNPKQIKDWADLTRADVRVVFANPKTSANGRFAYLSALAYAEQHTSDSQAFMVNLLKNVPVLEAGARSASIAFTQRNIGDVLIAPENEAALAAKTLGNESFEVVYPSLTAYTPVYVAEVTKNTAQYGLHQQAHAYLTHLWSEQAQQLAVENFFRPTNAKVLEKTTALFPNVNSFDVNETFGDWNKINQTYFVDNARFDREYIAAQQAKEGVK